MAITISGENNNDRILASDGVIDSLSGFNVVGVLTATSFTGDLTGNVTGNVTGNLTGNVNHTSNLLLQISGSEKFRVGTSGQLGIGGANYGTSGQVLTSGGSGSAVSWSAVPAQITFSNPSNNRILTSEGGIGVNAEANLTYDGSTLAVTGAIDANGDLDVDGHTNLDNVSIAGITTFASNINVTGNIFTTKYIYHTNDTDTYFDFGTNTINLAAGGNIGLTILDSSVRVTDKLGINGASPQTPLDVIANGSGYAINIRGRSSDNVGELRFTSNNYGSLYGTLKGGATYLNFAVDSISSVLRLNSTGLVTMDNGTAQLCMRDSGVVDNAIFYIGGGTRTQTSTTTDFTQICLYDKNSQYNTQTANGSWKSKIKFFAAQMNGGAREGAFVGQDTTYNNFSGSTLKMRSDLIFGTRGDAQTSSGDAATEKLRIRHNGQVQISEPAGTSGDGASLNFHFANNNSTDVISSIYFSNNVGTVAAIKGQTRNGNNYGMITFHNDVNGVDGESMRLNHDGGFCVGTDSTRTAEFTTPDGFSVRSRDSAKGQFQVSVTNETCALLNKKGNNGQIIGFRKDGTGVGEIGVNASTMYLNFGGTVSASHQLDDYEEGSFTPTYSNTGGVTPAYNYQEGRYTKIGNLVTCSGIIGCTNANSFGSSKRIEINLPFTCASNTYGQAGGSLVDGMGWQNVTSNAYQAGTIISGGVSYGRIVTLASSPSNVYYTGTPGLQNNHYFRFRFTYPV